MTTFPPPDNEKDSSKQFDERFYGLLALMLAASMLLPDLMGLVREFLYGLNIMQELIGLMYDVLSLGLIAAPIILIIRVPPSLVKTLTIIFVCINLAIYLFNQFRWSYLSDLLYNVF